MKINDLLPNSYKTASFLGIIGVFILSWLLAIGVIIGLGFLLMITWNNSVVDMFGAPEIGLWNTSCFVILLILLKFIVGINIKIGNKT